MTLKQNETWELVTLLPGKKTVGCKWVYTIKLNSDGSKARLKEGLVAKGYSHVYGLDYVDTLSSGEDDICVVLVSLAATYHWPLHLLEIKNAFLNGILHEEIYMKQPLNFVAQGECVKVCTLKKSRYGLK